MEPTMEKLTQIELGRIEKYVDKIHNKKMGEICDEYNTTMEAVRDKTKEKIKTDKKLNAMVKELREFFVEIKAIEKARNLTFDYDTYDNAKDAKWSLGRSHDFPESEKLEKEKNSKLKLLREKYNQITENMIFADKPNILKAIKELEKL